MTESNSGYFAAEWILEVSSDDDIFLNPKETAGNIANIIIRFLPSARFLHIHDVEDRPETYKYEFALNSVSFYVYVNPINTWLDISECHPGFGGSTVYAAVASFSHNTQRIFIGDPDGLSDIALRRRLDNMLCSAIKHRSTDHLAPHDYQLEGNQGLGVPPLNWRRGDTLYNIQQMIEASISSIESLIPEISNVHYDFEKKSFGHLYGGIPLLEEIFSRWSNQLAGSGSARAGVTTFKRGILLRSLVHQESGTRRILLEQALCDPNQFVTMGDLSGLIY